MKVFIVHQLRWLYNDEFHDKTYTEPIKAFLDRRDAADFLMQCEKEIRESEPDFELDEEDEFREIFPHKDKEFKTNFFEIIEANIL